VVSHFHADGGDPYDASLIEIHRAGEMSAARRWVDTADELHFGTLGSWGGLWSKLLWAFLGMLLPILIISGAWISLRRGGGKWNPPARIGGLLTIGLLAASCWWGFHEIRGYGLKSLVPMGKSFAVFQKFP